MTSQWPTIFEESVARHFRPMGERVCLKLEKLGDGFFEIAGATLAMRIRRGTGHLPDFLVTLLRKKKNADFHDLAGEIGLGRVAEFYGRRLEDHGNVFLKAETAIQDAANMAEETCIPYLTGEATNFEDIRQFVEKIVNKSMDRFKDYKFPPNVKKMWPAT